MAVTPEAFKQALQHWASGVAVVTSKSDEFGVRGMTVTAFSSVSMEPPLILVCLNSTADTGENIDRNGRFAVNILSTEQEDASNNFSGGSSQEERFARAAWRQGLSGVPILEDCIMALECSVKEKVRAGSHWILIGEVEHTHCPGGEPLLYFRGGYRKFADH